MTQLEIEYFWPLTEQIKLDLDYTPSEEWIAESRKKQSTPVAIGVNGGYLVSNGGAITGWSELPKTHFVVKASEKNVGKWEITDNMFVYRPSKPNAVIRFFAKKLLGFKWHDE